MKIYVYKKNLNKQILTAMTMFQFCKDHIAGINFLRVTVDNMNDIRAFLTKRSEAPRTVPGTRSYHQYESLNENVCKRVSCDAEFDLKFELTAKAPITTNVKVSDYVMCMYDNYQWVGIVCDIDILIIPADHITGLVEMTCVGYLHGGNFYRLFSNPQSKYFA